MSNQTQDNNSQASDLLPDEMKQQPVPLQFLITIADALESRIDYNFNSLIQISMLVEYMHIQLAEKGINIELDEDFKAFQEKRLSEIQQEFETIKSKMDPQAAAEELVNNKVNLEDD
jgi:hypothetical protein